MLSQRGCLPPIALHGAALHGAALHDARRFEWNDKMTGPVSVCRAHDQRRGGLGGRLRWRRVLIMVLGLSVPVFGVDAQSASAPPAPGSEQIIGDRSAAPEHRPVVLRSPSGVPQVQMTTPSEQGVSRNVYRQFDVGADGAILNNARTATPSQLGGLVGGNPWLAKGTARVIVNEVNSPAPSQLRGMLEVAGDRAEVIIANPSGIGVNGGGFLNAARVSLISGRPEYQAGALSGVRLGHGRVHVEGAGLEARHSEQLRILTQALQLDAELRANAVHAELGGPGSSASPADPPRYLLDVSALGGMSAGQIVLVGTSAGLGVRNAGHLEAHAGELVVTVDGRLENRGVLRSSHSVEVAAAQVDNRSGLMSSGQGLALSAQTLDNRNGQIIGEDLQIAAPTLLNQNGQLLAGRDLHLTSERRPDGRYQVGRDQWCDTN